MSRLVSNRLEKLSAPSSGKTFAADMRAADHAVAGGASVPVDIGLAVDASGGRTRFATTGACSTVAIIDSGLNLQHEDFGGPRQVRVVDFCASQASPVAGLDRSADESGHGSHLAGIVAGDGGHIGIAPGADLLALRVLSGPRASGDLGAVQAALDWLVACPDSRGVDVVLLAIADGGCHADGLDPAFADPLGSSIDALIERRVPVVAPAGNRFGRIGGRDGMAYPAARGNLVSVAGCVKLGASWRLTGASQRSPGTSLAAPSGPYASSCAHGISGTSVREGTSQASAVVAGALALLQRRHLDIMGARADVQSLLGWLCAGARHRIGELPVVNVEGALQALEQARGRRLRTQ